MQFLAIEAQGSATLCFAIVMSFDIGQGNAVI